jgi:hypothetical protein
VSDDSFVGYVVGDLITNVLIVPLSALAATVVYVELRRVKGEPLAQDSAPTQALGADPPVPPPAAPEAPTMPQGRIPEPPPGGPEAPAG